jgi:hypothetical protein
MFRFGLTENVEFRIRYNEVWQFGDTEDRNGSEYLRWSFKFHTTEQRGWIPESGLEVRFTAPTGGSHWSTNQVDFGLDYIYGWRLSENVEIYGSTSFSTNALGDFSFVLVAPATEDFILYTQSVALGLEMTEKTTAFVEFFGLFSDGLEANEQSPVFFNIGVDYTSRTVLCWTSALGTDSMMTQTTFSAALAVGYASDLDASDLDASDLSYSKESRNIGERKHA